MKKVVKPCVVITKKDTNIVGLRLVQVMPVDYIKKNYGDLESFYASLEGTILEGGVCKIQKSNEYDECFIVA
ncbi:hypothetical protein FT641_18675 [Bacillus paranthracis]|uniref:hypothetical protein n=1 Tax=Bacillus paranthracis TaxID=2026186 RepID=UPI00187AC510|nr:hypothetical protein [Bacillus paranthracis]MBE7114410.1 hypothetical protein [Bacillus paranthracis]MBE7154716.1 hypothetical protein [Bacillus paranthracis]